MSGRRSIRSLLSGGDRRSIGRADEVLKLVERYPGKVDGVVECLFDSDECVRMRAADTLEKLSRGQKGILQPYKEQLLALSDETAQSEVKWHLAVMLPRLQLSVVECERVAERLQSYLEDRSSIVKTFAMQGLADLTRQDRNLRPRVVELIRVLGRTGTPAMRVRGRILLQDLEKEF